MFEEVRSSVFVLYLYKSRLAPKYVEGDTGVCLLSKHKIGRKEFKAQGIAVYYPNRQDTQLVSVSINPS